MSDIKNKLHLESFAGGIRKENSRLIFTTLLIIIILDSLYSFLE